MINKNHYRALLHATKLHEEQLIAGSKVYTLHQHLPSATGDHLAAGECLMVDWLSTVTCSTES